MSRHLRLRIASGALTAALIAALSMATISPAAGATTLSGCGGSTIALVNGGFEDPTIAPRSYRITNENNVPGWSTTASDRAIELWSTGFGGVPAAEGSQFAELNANMTSALFQDLATTPGGHVTWSLAHRGRAGVDTMRVLVGAAGGPMVQVAVMSDGTSGWGRHSGTYVVPPGQTTTRFQFEAVSTAGGNPTIGNFLDDIAFGSPACLVVTKKATVLGDPVPGATIRWTITTTNRGGAPAEAVTVTDSVPLRSVYIPGSMRVVTGPRSGAVTDAADADAGSLTGTSLKWKPFGASNIAGRLNPGESATVSFETSVADSAAGSQVTNEAHAQHIVGGDTVREISNQVTVEIEPVADVYVHKLFDQDTVAELGTGPAGFTLIVGNRGPFGADAVTAIDELPAGMSIDVQTISVDGASSPLVCTLEQAADPAQQVLLCDLGDLPPNSLRVLTVPAQYTKTTPGAVALTNTVSAHSARTVDPDLSNNQTQDTMVFDPGPVSDVTVSVSPQTRRSLPGAEVSWVIDAINATAIGLPATGVRVHITVPDFLEDLQIPAECTVSGVGELDCTAGTLAALSSKRFTISGKVKVNTPADATGTVSAAVSADDGSDSDLTNNLDLGTVVIDRPGALQITKTALDPVSQERIRFDVTVTSVGEFEARDVVLSDIADDATAVSYPDTCTLVSDRELTCDLGVLASGESITLHFEFTTAKYGSALTNTASVSGSNTGEPMTASATALPIVPEFGERRLPGGVETAGPPPPMAFTGPGAHQVTWPAALALIAGMTLLVMARRRTV